MIRITSADVRLALAVDDRDAAIRAAGALLAERGYADAEYAESMLRREGAGGTCVGSGIAIPHGLPDDRARIRRPGAVVLQLDGGVDWDGGQRVRLVVAIAAPGNEHLGLLAALTDVLDDPVAAERLERTTDGAEIAAALCRGAPGAVLPDPAERGGAARGRPHSRPARAARAPGDVPGGRGDGLRRGHPRGAPGTHRERQGARVAAQAGRGRRRNRAPLRRGPRGGRGARRAARGRGARAGRRRERPGSWRGMDAGARRARHRRRPRVAGAGDRAAVPVPGHAHPRAGRAARRARGREAAAGAGH